MRSVIFLIIGLIVGGVGATLFQRSLPPPTGSKEEEVALLQRELARASKRIAYLETTEANAAQRLQDEASSGARSILQDLKAGRPVDVEDVFQTAKPVLRDLAPVFDNLRRREQKKVFERMVADLTSRYHLDAAQQGSLKSWFAQKSEEQARQFRELVGREGTRVEDLAKATHDVRPHEGLDAFMEQTLRGDDLVQFKNDRMTERVSSVQHEADAKVQRLDGMVELDPAQEDQVFALMARSSRDFDPGMQLEGLGEDKTTLSPGQSRDEAILAVLRPEQRQAYEDHRARQRQEAEEKMNEIGLKMPANWDLFDDQ